MGELLSVIIPAFNEEMNIQNTVKEISMVLENASIVNELVFVNDGSKDHTWNEILEASVKYSNVRGISFSRNFGKEAAIIAGLEAAKGDCCVVIDCDLQHPPIKIVEMYNLWLEGYEVVEGQKTSRGKESGMHSFAAKTFYDIISRATGIDMQNASDFKLLDREVVDVLVGMKERNAFFRALSSWVGYKSTVVYFDVQERAAGESKWSTRSLVKYALNNISSFSSEPMQMVTFCGGLTGLMFAILAVITIVQAIIGVDINEMRGIYLVILFVGSVLMIGLGITGYYIGKIYDEIKERPKYLVSEVCGGKDEK